MTRKAELQQTVNAQCGVIERLQIERDSALDEVRMLRSVAVSAEVGGSLEDAKEPWMLQGNTVRGNAFASSDASEMHTVTIKRDGDGKWQALVDGAVVDEGVTTSEEPQSVAEGFAQLTQEILAGTPAPEFAVGDWVRISADVERGMYFTVNYVGERLTLIPHAYYEPIRTARTSQLALVKKASDTLSTEPQEPVEYDESKSERGPDSPRVPRDDDYLLAGQLSTVWPLSTFHPSESINLAIYLRDHLNVEPS